MVTHLGFQPDADRARQLDRRMHAELGRSLRYLGQQCRAAGAFDVAGLERVAASLEQGDRYAPSIFAHYYRLVPLLAEGRLDDAERCVQRLAQAQPVGAAQVVQPLRDRRQCEKSALYHALMTEDPSTPIDLLPPTATKAEAFAERYQRGMALMAQAMPELAGEVRAIVREVICVVGDPAAKVQFDGGSHFQLWGALFLNADHHPTDYAIVEVVAHESAHSLLFGFCTDEPLVLNSDDELYASPLRHDPRPMDGIYHATFVSARMHWAMSRLLDAGQLDSGTRAAAEAARDADRRNFDAGHTVIAEHARLTDTGRALMDAARDYMDAVHA
ncbi:MAG: HEXXH motif-containing putative peptide modification protein [Phycisphaeraceae bacterium]